MPPIVVLVRPQLGENIGMAARAMLNFGLDELRLVAPRDGFADDGPVRDAALAAATAAACVVERATLWPDLESAIGDCHHALATTARARAQAKPVSTPGAAMPAVLAQAAAGQRTALVFGPERTGLENAEIAACTGVLTLPVNPAFASLNLAQAVLLVAYEWGRAAMADAPPFVMDNPSPPATREAVNGLAAMLDAHLDAAGFYRPVEKRGQMRLNLRGLLDRAALTAQDVSTLRGMVAVLGRPRLPRR